MCIFIVRIYVKAWFTASNPIASSNHDLHFLQLLDQYETVIKSIANATRKKFTGHLWHLSEELIGFACFDATVPVESKRAMVRAINEKKGIEEPANASKLK